jgi:predicted SAM-dependent methyltransferase
MIETIKFKSKIYPKFQSEGNAAQFAIPYAKHVCKGKGVDVGCNRIEWSFPNSIPVDPAINPQYDALNFPPEAYELDYIFSSHCLEHLYNWVSVLDYWTYKLKSEGVLFLYLPDYSQEYWKPWNNRKHLNIFTPEIISDYMKDNGYKNIFKSEVDLNNAFMIMGEKI